MLWSKQAGYVDDQGQVLNTGSYQHIAIANPKLAPYGTAAMQDSGEARPFGTGATQGGARREHWPDLPVCRQRQCLGFVALSQVMEEGRLREGSAWVVPGAMHAPIRQDAVLLNSARDNAAAKALMAYLKGDIARAIIKSYGYAF